MSTSFAFPSVLSDRPGMDNDCVRHFDGTQTPYEVHALGEPDQVHRPDPLINTLLQGRYLLAVLLPVGLVGLYWVIFQELQRKGQLAQLRDPLALLVFGGLFALSIMGAVLLARMPVTKATIFLYQRAVVVAEGKRLTLIPWKHLLFARSRISTPEGQEFYCGWLENHDRFEERIWEMSEEHWAPVALAQIQAGETLKLGDLAVSTTHISYRGKTAAWEQVGSLILIVGRRYQMNISLKGSWLPWVCVNMHEIPNGRAMQQVISNVCPPHLLSESA